MMKPALSFIFLCMLLGMSLAFRSFAQLVSPGELSRAHAKLEGMSNCTKCHNFGDKTFRNQCLNCHVEIRTRILARNGYHYTTRNIECAACHKDHHGRGFVLIRWDPGKFDHQQATFPLEGKHAEQECKKCHNPANIKAKDIAAKSDAVKSRTYLGLSENCSSCHADMHRGQLPSNCGSCHSPAGWKPASGFSHGQARFKLVGKHAETACLKCHPTKSDGKNLYGQTFFSLFKGVKFSACLDCHEDHHKGAFGNACDKCHTPVGWKSVKLTQSNFNHTATRFPLRGLHAGLACEKCHIGGNWKKFGGVDLSKCTTCHEDYHQGQFTKRSDGGECSFCHTVNGYRPALFESAEHARTKFPLTGAHGAIPCSACHKQKIVLDGKETSRFHWDDFRCTQCHQDQHAGQFARIVDKEGCESCHGVDSWKSVRFDHAKTQFPLLGKHDRVDCAKCHKIEEIKGKQTIRYAIARLDCASCHEDYHAGQLADGSTHRTDCARCHNPSGWNTITFDHTTQSRFALSGKHATIACSSCHKKTTAENGRTTIVFKPIDTRCTYCHSDKKLE